jgi:hypothetical protein
MFCLLEIIPGICFAEELFPKTTYHTAQQICPHLHGPIPRSGYSLTCCPLCDLGEKRMEMIRDRSFQSCFYENASLRLLAPPQEWKTQPVTGRPKKSTKEPPEKLGSSSYLLTSHFKDYFWK